MPTFTGTNREFKRYVGPRLRNFVQMITKKHKAAVGACEHCGMDDELESAHVKGRDRNQIIDILFAARSLDSVVTVDLQLFEKSFKSEHDPVEKAILILCRKCHKKYDAATDATQAIEPGASTGISDKTVPRAAESLLPIKLDPPRATDFKRQLLVRRSAEISVYYSDGRIVKRPWDASKFLETSNLMGNLRSRPEFRQGAWQAAGIIKVDVRVVATDA